MRPTGTIRLPDSLRAELAEPFGPVLSTRQLAELLAGESDGGLVCVGDVVTRTVLELGFRPALAVVDGHTQRGRPADGLEAAKLVADRVTTVSNGPAVIEPAAWDAVVAGLEADGFDLVVVDGEEDLLAIPVFATAVPSTKVLYGMPGRGVVLVRTDDALRKRVGDMLAQFAMAEE